MMRRSSYTAAYLIVSTTLAASAGLSEFDADARFHPFIGSGRASKTMVTTRTKSGSTDQGPIGHELLREAVQSILTSEHGWPALIESLDNRDPLLVQKVGQSLEGMNVPSDESIRLISDRTSPKHQQILRSLLTSALRSDAGMQPLTEYFLGTDPASSRAGESSLYDLVWEDVIRRIERDPKLRTSYMDRLGDLDQFRSLALDVLAGALREGRDAVSEEHLMSLARGLKLEAVDPRSRAAHEIRKLERVNDATKGTVEDRKQSEVHHLAQAIGQRLAAGDHNLGRWLFWYMTRPAEAVSHTVRQALVQAVAVDPTIGTKLLRAAPLFTRDGSFDEAVLLEARMTRHEFFDLVDVAAEGPIEPQTAARYSRAFARVLQVDDLLWNRALEGAQNHPHGIVSTLVRMAIEVDPRVVIAWLHTATRNDGVLGNALVDFVAAEEQVSREQARVWLLGLDQEASTNQIIANEGLARFRRLFTAFLRQESGWAVAWRRLAVESYCPAAMRRLVRHAAHLESGQFWRLFRRAAAGTGPRAEAFRFGLAGMLLELRIPEVILGHLVDDSDRSATTDLLYQFLLEEPAVFEEWKDSLVRGETGSQWSSVGLLAVQRILETADGRSNNSRVAEISISILAHEPQRNRWEDELREIIFTEHRVDSAAAIIRARAALFAKWSDFVVEQLVSDPRHLLSVIANQPEALASTLESEFIEFLVADRFVFEEIVSSEFSDWRALVRQVSAEKGLL